MPDGPSVMKVCGAVPTVNGVVVAGVATYAVPFTPSTRTRQVSCATRIGSAVEAYDCSPPVQVCASSPRVSNA